MPTSTAIEGGAGEQPDFYMTCYAALLALRAAAFLIEDDDQANLLIGNTYRMERRIDVEVIHLKGPGIESMKVVFLAMRKYVGPSNPHHHLREPYDRVMPLLSQEILKRQAGALSESGIG